MTANPDLFREVPGQELAVATLLASVARPVHSYLLAGPPGSGKDEAATAFAAALLCPNGGCGVCDTCERALRGTHPDLIRLRRSGATVSIDDLRTLNQLALRRPLEASRQVLIVEDLHLATRTAPAILKTVEEPPPTTVFILLADDVPPELVTIASRSSEIAFPALTVSVVAAALERRGVDPDQARLVARSAGGDLVRAQLLVDDPGFAERLRLWRSIPRALDGYGATVARLVAEIQGAIDAALVPLKARHEAIISELEEEAQSLGERGVPGRKDIVDRHTRAERRFRTDELRAGLAVLQRSYGDIYAELCAAARSERTRTQIVACEHATTLITDAVRTMVHNPNETLFLEALFVQLSRLDIPA